jgi:hypothetical protein
LLIDLAYLLNGRFELLIFGQTAPHLGNLFFADASLADARRWITDSENRYWMAFPAITLGAAGPVTDCPLEERAAKDVAGIRKRCGEAITFSKNSCSIHY